MKSKTQRKYVNKSTTSGLKKLSSSQNFFIVVRLCNVSYASFLSFHSSIVLVPFSYSVKLVSQSESETAGLQKLQPSNSTKNNPEASIPSNEASPKTLLFVSSVYFSGFCCSMLAYMMNYVVFLLQYVD